MNVQCKAILNENYVSKNKKEVPTMYFSLFALEVSQP